MGSGLQWSNAAWLKCHPPLQSIPLLDRSASRLVEGKPIKPLPLALGRGLNQFNPLDGAVVCVPGIFLEGSEHFLCLLQRRVVAHMDRAPGIVGVDAERHKWISTCGPAGIGWRWSDLQSAEDSSSKICFSPLEQRSLNALLWMSSFSEVRSLRRAMLGVAMGMVGAGMGLVVVPAIADGLCEKALPSDKPDYRALPDVGWCRLHEKGPNEETVYIYAGQLHSHVRPRQVFLSYNRSKPYHRLLLDCETRKLAKLPKQDQAHQVERETPFQLITSKDKLEDEIYISVCVEKNTIINQPFQQPRKWEEPAAPPPPSL